MNDGNKATETELKLVLPNLDTESGMIAILRERGYIVKKPDHVRNVDIYMDTFDWLLMKNKLSLRYRFANGKAIYTIKSIGTIADGIAERMEIEVPLSEPASDPAVISTKKIKEIIGDIIYPRKLLEHVQICTERTRYQVILPQKAEFEMAFDTSSFSLRGLHKPRRTQKLQELEVEIISGPASALKNLSMLLSSKFNYPPSTKSKLEVAINRLKVIIPSKKPPEALMVRHNDRLDLAVRKFLTHQLNRFCENIPGVIRDIDTEFVHQARVATRRMRSTLRLFGDAVPLNTGIYFSKELKWLGEMFGAVRDVDVFLLNLNVFEHKIKRFPAKKKTVLNDWIEKHRRAPLGSLIEAIDSQRYKNFERRLRRFIEGNLPARPRSPLALKLVSEVAPVIIMEKFNAVIKQGMTVIAKPKLKEFHGLRIQMKRLRYACEFMAPALSGVLEPFIERTVEIQDCLGEIQDTVFTRGFIDDLFDDWKGKLVNPELVFILGEIYQLQVEIANDRQKRFSKIWEKFDSEETIGLIKDILPIKTTADSKNIQPDISS
ncbi:MAG TPA: CHAD domain-containing protein [Smithella sp.]|nr:CHAD domain-containing protein [Smithella sp.]